MASNVWTKYNHFCANVYFPTWLVGFITIVGLGHWNDHDYRISLCRRKISKWSKYLQNIFFSAKCFTKWKLWIAFGGHLKLLKNSVLLDYILEERTSTSPNKLPKDKILPYLVPLRLDSTKRKKIFERINYNSGLDFGQQQVHSKITRSDVFEKFNSTKVVDLKKF